MSSSSSANVDLSVLRTLHRLHRQLTDLRERIDRGPKQLKANQANIAHREAELVQVREELKAMRMAVDQKQLQLKGGEDKIRDHKRKLMGAETNREYQILKDQIAADEMAISVLEDEIIEAMERVDQFQPKIAEAEVGLAAARQKSEQVGHDLQSQQPLLEADAARLEGELKTCEAALPPTVKEIYQRVVRSRGEDALAPIEGEYCGGCNQHVPLNVCAEIRMCHPMFCKSCGRLLYLPEGA